MVEYVYGPVFSRRLGRSLGVDLVPLKICTYDCVYCQLGRTTNKTLERREYVPLPDVLSQLDRRLRDKPALDFITLAGSGEPTLYARLPEVIRAVKQRTATPLAVLTNGSLLWDPQVRDSLREADLVIPSLDAGNERIFQYVNRPHEDIAFEKMVDGLVAFRHEFVKPIWLEVFLLGGITAIDVEVQKMVHLVDQIRPDRVQLNTVARPPVEAFAIPVPDDQLRALAAMFGHRGEVIAARPDTGGTTLRPATEADILNLLRRRPCTLRDLADGLRLHPAEAMKQIDHLLAGGLLTAASEGGHIFYRAPHNFLASPKTQLDTAEHRVEESGAFWDEDMMDVPEEYSALAVERFYDPRNRGPMTAPDGHAVITGPCGDTMEIWLRVANGRISQATFTTDGCGPSLASGSMATELAGGKTLDEAARIEQQDILDTLGGLPEGSRHCALLAANTLKAAIENFRNRRAE